MRIGYVVKRYPRFSETFIVNEILAHESAGIEVHVFALRPPADTHFQQMLSRVRAPVTYLTPDRPKIRELWDALGVLRDKPPAPGVLDALLEAQPVEAYQAALLARHAREQRIDHLHAHFATSPSAVTRLASLLAGVPYTMTAHAKDIFHEDVDGAELRRKMEDAHAVVTVSDYNVRYLRERVTPRARVVRIYNGLDLTDFPYRSPDVRRPLILAVGRLVEKKGFGSLLEACAILRDRGRSFSCHLIGGGVCEASLREQHCSLALGDTVRLLGPLPRAEVLDQLRRAAVFAAPCVTALNGDRDGLPTVLLEAMAAGTPCVATPVTGIPEVVRDRETGLLVLERNPLALADAIDSLLEDSALRVRLAQAARTLIEREFNVGRNTERQRALFVESTARLAAESAA